MKIIHILATAAFGALLSACQPAPVEQAPADTQSAATIEPASTETATPAQPGPEAQALPCGVLAQRNWEAELSSGSPATLTVSGEIDLGTPGYGVSLIRNASETADATSTTLTLSLRAPSGMQPQVVTAHPVRYFAPANGQFTSVQIACDGALLTTINITR